MSLAALLVLLAPTFITLQEPAPAPPEDLAAVAALCEHIEATVALEAVEELRAIVDVDALLVGAFEGIDVNTEFLAGLREQIVSTQPPWSEIVASNRDFNGSFHFLRTRPTLPLRGIFRNSGDDGLNYMEFEFARDSKGQLRVVDYYSHVHGSWVQDTYRDFALPLLEQIEKGSSARLGARDKAMVQAVNRILRIREKMQDDPKAALKLFDALSVEIRYEPALLILRLQIAMAVSEEEYLATLDEFAKRYPDSPAGALMSIDRHALREEWDQSLAALDRVDASVGGDPYIDIMRANVLIIARRFDEALVCANAAIDGDSRIAFEALWLPITIALERKDPEAVYDGLVRIDERYELEWVDLSQNPAYAVFVESPQYERWLRYLESKTKR